MSNNCSICIDHREKYLIPLFSTDSIKVEALDLGDVHLLFENQFQILIERKTIQDFWSSIIDHRFKEQRARYKDWSQLSSFHYVIYLIEYDGELEENKQQTIEKAIHRLSFLYQFMVVKVASIQKTRDYIIWLSQQNSLFKETDIKRDKMETWIQSVVPKKKEIQTPQHLIIVILMCIPSISYRIAKCLTFECQSIYHYIEYLKKLSMETFSQTVLDNKKKIGIQKSKLVYQFLGI